MGMPGWLPAAGGSVLGIVFLLSMDYLLPHFTPESFHCKEGETSRRRTALLVLAVTLHNIPEGMAVGVSFALAAQSGDPALLPAATALAMGVGIQNFPEGAAISLPLHQEGMGRFRAFLIGGGLGAGGAHLRPAHRAGWPGRSSLCSRGCSPLPPAPCSMSWWRSSSQKLISPKGDIPAL